jgi:alpha-ketoglutarate-dependent taurine dioxygenase
LETGDLLVIDNNKTIHGRKPFQARYDGTDRWVQRILVRKELPPSDQINGHIITTEF